MLAFQIFLKVPEQIYFNYMYVKILKWASEPFNRLRVTI